MLSTLVVVPTELEYRVVGAVFGRAAREVVRIERCGFGIAAAAARTSALLARLAPARVLLVGIAGRFDDRLAIGSACRFDRVACHGIGVGSGAAFVSAATLGWPQWQGDPADPASAIGDLIPCSTGRGAEAPRAGLLLTACSASADAGDVAARRRLHPDAAAEDMEGFAVAMACRLAGVPLDIVRGISNTAGDRNHSAWRIDAAAEAAADLAVHLLTDDA